MTYMRKNTLRSRGMGWGEERKKRADANAALQHLEAQQIERYNDDMASYQEECATLAADGVPKKFWPKKTTHPIRGRQINQNNSLSHDSPHSPIPMYYTLPIHCHPCQSHCRPGWSLRRLWIWGFWGLIQCTIFSICSYTYNIYYMYFFCDFYCPPLPFIAAAPVSGDSALPDWVLVQKICGNLCKVHKNNKNILQSIWRVC